MIFFLFLSLASKSRVESIVHLRLLESMKMTWCCFSSMTLIKGGICWMCMAKCEMTCGCCGVFWALIQEPVWGTWPPCQCALDNVLVADHSRALHLHRPKEDSVRLCKCASGTDVNDFQDLAWIWLHDGGSLLMLYWKMIPLELCTFKLVLLPCIMGKCLL